MSFSIQMHIAVRGEIKAAMKWYEEKRRGLGKEFLQELNDVLDRITENPTQYGLYDSDTREGALTRFPYVVYYRIRRNQIRVIAVYHTSRNQSGWSERN